MAADPDDEALAWAGETDPSHVAGPAGPKPAEPEPAEPTEPMEPSKDAATGSRQVSSALLVTYGILAGVYLIYSLGWIIAIQRSTLTFADLLVEIMYQFGEFLAIVSPIVWFATVLLMTKDSQPISRVLWLLLGIVVLVPWPFLLSGA